MGDSSPAAEIGHIVLGSRSPRRYELLSLLVGEDRILVCPPVDPAEPGFDELRSMAEIADRLSLIARAKSNDVTNQLTELGTLSSVAAVLTADTVIVARDEQGSLVVLGQPPDDDTWRNVVREWFERYLLRAPHTAMTTVCISTPDDRIKEQVTSTDVLFRAATREWLDWYLQTEEPRGKAGGYALQGAGSLFVESIHGSPSNVIGLPLHETAQMLREGGLLDATGL